MVLNYGNNKPYVFEYDKIQPQSDSRIYTKKVKKQYLPTCQKGIIDDELNVFPFGYDIA